MSPPPGAARPDGRCLPGRLPRASPSPRTLEHYSGPTASYRRSLATEVPGQMLADVTIVGGRSWVESIADRRSPASIGNAIAGLRVFTRWTIAEGHLRVDPLERIRKPRAEPPSSVRSAARSRWPCSARRRGTSGCYCRRDTDPDREEPCSFDYTHAVDRVNTIMVVARRTGNTRRTCQATSRRAYAHLPRRRVRPAGLGLHRRRRRKAE